MLWPSLTAKLLSEHRINNRRGFLMHFFNNPKG